MHHLIKSMRKCLRKAISNDGGAINYLQFMLLYCLMPIFVLKNFYFSFILQLAVIFIFIVWIVILSLIIIAKKILKNFTPYLNFRDCIWINMILKEMTQ